MNTGAGGGDTKNPGWFNLKGVMENAIQRLA
jgi:hypothetical protein